MCLWSRLRVYCRLVVELSKLHNLLNDIGIAAQRDATTKRLLMEYLLSAGEIRMDTCLGGKRTE